MKGGRKEVGVPRRGRGADHPSLLRALWNASTTIFEYQVIIMQFYKYSPHVIVLSEFFFKGWGIFEIGKKPMNSQHRYLNRHLKLLYRN